MDEELVECKTNITVNNCMRSTDNLDLVPKHIMTSLPESSCLIIFMCRHFVYQKYS